MNHSTMTVYEVIKALQAANGKNEKLAILQANKDVPHLAEYLKAVFDPKISYYQKKIDVKLPVSYNELNIVKSIPILLEGVEFLSQRDYTGNEAKIFLTRVWKQCNDEHKELLEYIIGRNIKAGVAESTILSVFPDLFFIPPYCRCSVLDDKMITKIEKAITDHGFVYVQTKEDGEFVNIVFKDHVVELYTRNGNQFPHWLAEQIRTSLYTPITDYVMTGEAVVYQNGKLLDRKTGNGVLNSVLSGEEQSTFVDYEFKFKVWDGITFNEWKIGESKENYYTRFNKLCDIRTSTMNLGSNLCIVDTHNVESLEECFEIYSEVLSEGGEGVIVKLPTMPWKDHTSTEQIKLKLAFDIEVEIFGFEYGAAGKKNAKVAGSLLVRSKDHKVVFNVGTGLNDKERLDIVENFDLNWKGKVCMITGNDLLQSKSKSSNLWSVFTPSFQEIRHDKTEADDYETIVKIYEAAKLGRKYRK